MDDCWGSQFLAKDLSPSGQALLVDLSESLSSVILEKRRPGGELTVKGLGFNFDELKWNDQRYKK
jgi:hypothetical protein